MSKPSRDAHTDHDLVHSNLITRVPACIRGCERLCLQPVLTLKTGTGYSKSGWAVLALLQPCVAVPLYLWRRRGRAPILPN